MMKWQKNFSCLLLEYFFSVDCDDPFSMKTCFTTALLLICISPLTIAAIYKCKTPNGSIKYTDRPCADEAEQTVIKEKITYTAALNQLIQEQIKQRDMADSDESKAGIRSLVEAQALNIFTRIETFEKALPICSPVLKDNNKDIDAVLEDYKEDKQITYSRR